MEKESKIFEWVQFDPKDNWWVSGWNFRPEVIKDLKLPSRVFIKDSTLREGEETPNVNMSLNDKMAIVRMLSEMGIHEVDVGYAGAVERDRVLVRKIKSERLNIRLAAHARTLVPEFKKEIDTIAQLGAEIIQFIFHPIPVEGFKRKDYADRLEEAVRYAKKQGLFTVFLPTWGRWEFGFCQELLQAAVKGGLDRICPGGMGVLHVSAFKGMIQWMKGLFPNLQVGVHVHNDYGLGTACSLAAVEAGAEVVDVSVNGMCDRGGIAALEEVAMALRVLYNIDLGIKLDRLTELSKLVQKISGIRIEPYRPIVGKYMFVQTTDAHIVAELKGKWSKMNSFNPSYIGGKSKILFGPQSLNGQGLRAKIEAMGLKAKEEQIVGLLHDLEKLLQKKKSVSEKEMEGMIKKKVVSGKKGVS